MLRLDYALSPAWNASSDVDLASAEEWELRYDCFLGDVIFMVYEMDLSARWGWVPVLDFALALDAIVDALAVGHEVEELFEFTESDASILFRRAGDLVEVDASYVPDVATVSYADLRGEVKQFLLRVLEGLIGLHGELATNPFIARKFSAAT
jgi:hypothetical protein